jgi:uncharacterized membrane protein
MLLTNVFLHFKQCSDTEQSLAWLSEKLMETLVTSVSILLEIIMSKLAYFNSVDQLTKTAIKNRVDLGWIGSVGSLYIQSLANGATEIYISW